MVSKVQRFDSCAESNIELIQQNFLRMLVDVVSAGRIDIKIDPVASADRIKDVYTCDAFC